MNGITSEQLFTEFIELVDQLIMKPAKLIIFGDFIIPQDVQHSGDTKRLIDLLHSLYLLQTITEPTHEDGHTIDLVVSHEADNLLNSLYVSSQISHYCVVHGIPNVSKPLFPCKHVSYCKYCSVHTAQFKEDIINSEIVCEPALSVDELVSQYNCTLKNLLDEHDPKKSCFVVDHPMVP